MRLICGAVFFDGRPLPPDLLPAMCTSMQPAARPSRVLPWIGRSAGIAVLDFAGIPSAIPQNAISFTRSGDPVAADVRLDAPKDLLIAQNANPVAVDAAVVARVLGEPTPETLRELSGDFAAAAWSQSEQRLTLLRDALGVRPLVYHHRPGEWVLFASFERALLASGLVPRQLNRRIFSVEGSGWFDSEHTLLKDIDKVPPGTALVFTPNGVLSTTYWKPAAAEPYRGSFEEAAEELRDLVTAAVNAGLRGSGPVATHLSGGLDSSSITVLAARALRRQGRTLHAYSYLADPWPGRDLGDESPYVRAVLAQEPGIAWTPITDVLPPTWLTDRFHLENVVTVSDDYPLNRAYSLAGTAGAQVLLSGWGGDEGISFNGRGALAWALRNGHWRYLTRELGALRRRRGFRLHNLIWGDVLAPHLPRKVVAGVRALRGHHSASGYLTARELSIPDGNISPDPLQMQIELLGSPHIAARTASDALLASRYGIALVYPLLDRRIIEFVLSLSRIWHIRYGWKRSVYRAAMSGVLPNVIRDRDTKLVPLPRLFYEYSSQRDAIANRIVELRRHALLRDLFDLDRMEAVTRALPPPETAQMSVLAEIAPLLRALDYALYAAEHFC